MKKIIITKNGTSKDVTGGGIFDFFGVPCYVTVNDGSIEVRKLCDDKAVVDITSTKLALLKDEETANSPTVTTPYFFTYHNDSDGTNHTNIIINKKTDCIGCVYPPALDSLETIYFANNIIDVNGRDKEFLKRTINTALLLDDYHKKRLKSFKCQDEDDYIGEIEYFKNNIEHKQYNYIEDKNVFNICFSEYINPEFAKTYIEAFNEEDAKDNFSISFEQVNSDNPYWDGDPKSTTRDIIFTKNETTLKAKEIKIRATGVIPAIIQGIVASRIFENTKKFIYKFGYLDNNLMRYLYAILTINDANEADLKFFVSDYEQQYCDFFLCKKIDNMIKIFTEAIMSNINSSDGIELAVENDDGNSVNTGFYYSKFLANRNFIENWFLFDSNYSIDATIKTITIPALAYKSITELTKDTEISIICKDVEDNITSIEDDKAHLENLSCDERFRASLPAIKEKQIDYDECISYDTFKDAINKNISYLNCSCFEYFENNFLNAKTSGFDARILSISDVNSVDVTAVCSNTYGLNGYDNNFYFSDTIKILKGTFFVVDWDEGRAGYKIPCADNIFKNYPKAMKYITLYNDEDVTMGILHKFASLTYEYVEGNGTDSKTRYFYTIDSLLEMFCGISRYDTYDLFPALISGKSEIQNYANTLNVGDESFINSFYDFMNDVKNKYDNDKISKYLVNKGLFNKVFVELKKVYFVKVSDFTITDGTKKDSTTFTECIYISTETVANSTITYGTVQYKKTVVGEMSISYDDAKWNYNVSGNLVFGKRKVTYDNPSNSLSYADLNNNGEIKNSEPVVEYSLIKNSDGSIEITWDNRTSINPKFFHINGQKVLIPTGEN